MSKRGNNYGLFIFSNWFYSSCGNVYLNLDICIKKHKEWYDIEAVYVYRRFRNSFLQVLELFLLQYAFFVKIKITSIGIITSYCGAGYTIYLPTHRIGKYLMC